MRAWCVIFVALAVGCDRESSAPAPPVKKAKELVVEIRGVTPLLPDRRTHVAPTGTGQVFVVQESGEAGGRETGFSFAEGGLGGGGDGVLIGRGRAGGGDAVLERVGAWGAGRAGGAGRDPVVGRDGRGGR